MDQKLETENSLILSYSHTYKQTFPRNILQSQ